MMQLIPCNLQVIICTELCKEGFGNYILNAMGSGVSSSFSLPMENHLNLEGSVQGLPLQSLPRVSLPPTPHLSPLPGSFHLHLVLTSVVLWTMVLFLSFSVKTDWRVRPCLKHVGVSCLPLQQHCYFFACCKKSINTSCMALHWRRGWLVPLCLHPAKGHTY